MGTKDRRQLEKENRRELILEAAEAIMTANGIYGLNVDMIAQQTQLAKGTIYLYFKSKEEILSTLTLRARNGLLNEFKKIEKKRIPPVEQLKEVVKAAYQYYKKKPLCYDLISLYEVNTQLTETEELYESSRQITLVVAGMAERAQKEGSLPPHINPVHLTLNLWGMTMGMLQLIKVRGDLIRQRMNISEKQLLTNFQLILESAMKK